MLKENVADFLIFNYKTDKAEIPSSPLPKNNKNHNLRGFCGLKLTFRHQSLAWHHGIHYLVICLWTVGCSPGAATTLSTHDHYDACPRPSLWANKCITSNLITDG